MHSNMSLHAYFIKRDVKVLLKFQLDIMSLHIRENVDKYIGIISDSQQI